MHSPNWMDISIERVGEATIAVVQGDTIVAANREDFTCKMAPLLTAQARVVLDLSGVRFVDSSGIGTIVSSAKTLKSLRGSLRICGATSPVRALFEMVKLDRLVEIYENREQAIDSFRSNEEQMDQ